MEFIGHYNTCGYVFRHRCYYSSRADNRVNRYGGRKMNAEKMLQRVLEYVDALDAEERAFVKKYSAESTIRIEGMPLTIICEIIAELKADIRANMAKSTGRNSQLKAVERILKNAKRLTETKFSTMHAQLTDISMLAMGLKRSS